MARWYILNVETNEYEMVNLDRFLEEVEKWEENGFMIETVEHDVCLFKYAIHKKLKVKCMVAFSCAC